MANVSQPAGAAGAQRTDCQAAATACRPAKPRRRGPLLRRFVKEVMGEADLLLVAALRREVFLYLVVVQHAARAHRDLEARKTTGSSLLMP